MFSLYFPPGELLHIFSLIWNMLFDLFAYGEEPIKHFVGIS